jgi:DNA modification methylase
MDKAKITDLKPDASNYNKHTEFGMSLLEKSIRKFGFVEAGLISEDDVICSGNARQETAVNIGMEDVQIIDIDGTKPVYLRKKGLKSGSNEFKELGLALNAVGKANVVFDAELVEAELGEAVCEEWGVETSKKLEAEEDDFQIPDEISTDIILGDLFEIGEHRLLCGSSTEADAVNKLLNGKEPYLMVTDPPYGVNYDPMWRASQADKGFGAKVKAKGKVMNDDKADWTEAWALSPAKVAYVWHGGKHAGEVSDSLTKCDFEIRSQIIWVKPSLTFSRGDYHWQHEPCWYAVKKGSKGNWAGDRKQTTTWHIAGINPAGRSQDKNDVVVGHGTQKPVECMSRAIANHDGDVHDPFLGSGSTMVAAHQLNRKCYGMELDPKYCQVIIDRMLKLDPTIEIKKNGESYKPKEDA